MEKIRFLQTQIPLVDTYDINNPHIRWFPMTTPTSGLTSLQDSYVLTGDVWYCNFTTENSFKFFNIKEMMGLINFNKVINKEALLVLDLSFEPFLKSIDVIYEYIVIKYKIPSSQVVFLSNMYDANEYNILVANKFNQSPIRILWFSALEIMLQGYNDILPNTLEIKSYDKKFLNLNRRWRSHRPLLVLLLYHKKLLDKGFVSFGPCDEHGDWEQIWNNLKHGASNNAEILNAISESESIKHMKPLYLDTYELHTNRAELTVSTNRYYEDSYFSVISETTFYLRERHQNSRFITEKTFKSIVMKHPFILVSIPKSLEVLKKLGYKTFSPWVDESYDREEDDNKRMMLIIKEVERLSNLSQQELELFLNSTKEICNYNYDVIKNKKKFVYER